MLFTKPPSANEVYNDIDESLVGFFEVLRDTKQRRRLSELLSNTPYALEEYTRCAERFEDETDPVERARQFYVLTHQSLNGRLRGGWSRDRRVSRARQFRNGLSLLREASNRLSNVTIENADFEKIIAYYDAETTLFYLDPPYLSATRRARRRYDNEMTDDDHGRLLSLVTKIKGMALLHGYSHPCYEEALTDWDRIEMPVRCASSVMGGERRRRPKRVEIVWTNYDLPNTSGEAITQ